jgi:hypothetical protein
MHPPKFPLDSFPYDRDKRSAKLEPPIRDGVYVYVQDIDGVTYFLPDGSHMHPKVLGGAQPAIYAGDLRIDNGAIADLTNLSGTFQFDDPKGLLAVAKNLEALGFVILRGAIRFFPMNGSAPLILR